MRARDSLAGAVAPTISVHDRILGDSNGPRDEALVFAASSIIKEITSTRYDGGLVQREVRTELGSYTLQGSRVAGPDGAHPVVLVYAAPVASAVPPLPDADEVRARLGLTRKEARVAVMLAAQKSNEQIAAELCISPHTARHHTQNILSKLALRSRREVAGVLGRGQSS